MRHTMWALVALALAGLSSGCHVCNKLRHHNNGCASGCDCGQCAGGQCNGHCGNAACGPSQVCGCKGQGCDICGYCGPRDPHPLLNGHQGPPNRGGVLSALHGWGNGGPPADAQPAPGPSAAHVSYPYYTTRGPRDFLAPNPRGIGP